MNAVDAVETHGGIPLRLRRMAAEEDRRHLLVILSGFRPHNAPYDFAQSSARQVGCDILWIQDEFDGGPTYYLRAHGERGPEMAVQAAIRTELERLDLGTDRLTVAGFSKGGSAAIYHGLTIGAANVLTTVPQLFVGSYVRDHWPKVLDRMSAPGRDDSQALDRIMPDLLESRAGADTNVYVISSESDPSHAEEIVPHLDALEALGRFTMIMSSWPQIQGHVDVTPQNRALVHSLLVQLTQGLAPRFGDARVGYLPPSRRVLDAQWERRDAVATVKTLRFDRDRLHMEGTGFVRGRPVTGYGDIARSLVLTGSSEQITFKLGTVLDETLSDTYHRGSPCDYQAGGFATVGYGGVALSEAAAGTYDLAIELVEHGRTVLAPLRADRALAAIAVDGSRVLRAKISSDSATVDVFPLVGQVPEGHDLRIEALDVTGGRLDVRGWFAVPSMPAKNWGDVEYYVLLRGSDGSTAGHRLGLLHRPRADVGWGRPEEFVKAYFAPLGENGVDVSSLAPGKYEILLTIADRRRRHTVMLGEIVVDGILDGRRDVAPVAVVGSCVTRDNFSSRLAPGWRSYASVVGEHYQSSLLSVFGAAVPIADQEFADLEAHAYAVVARELGREFLGTLRTGAPAVVIVDLFTDARFGVIDLPEGPVTDNSWKLTTSRDAVRFKDAPRAGMAHDRDAYLARIEAAARRLEAEVREQCPGATIVLHSARAALRWRDDVGEYTFPAAAIAEFNERWEALDAAFLRGAPSTVVIGGLGDGIVADARHPWGRYWVHYEADYYARFTDQLQSVLGFQREFRVERAPSVGANGSLSREIS